MDRTDKVQLCPVCYGTNELFPGEICRCGRSINFTADGVAYCGRQDCLTKLKAAA